LKSLKYAVALLAVAGLIGCFLPNHGASFWDRHTIPSDLGGGVHIYMVLAGYGLALVMGVAGIARSMRRSHAFTAAVGFGFVLLKLRGEVVDVLKQGDLNGRVMIIAALAGVLVSVVAAATSASE
jgi:hypothetical protein